MLWCALKLHLTIAIHPTLYYTPPSTIPHPLLYPTLYYTPPSTISHPLLYPTLYYTPPSTIPHPLLYPTLYYTPPSTIPHPLLYPTLYYTPHDFHFLGLTVTKCTLVLLGNQLILMPIVHENVLI